MSAENKSSLSEYLGVVSRIRIDHPAYKDVLDELKDALDAIGHTSMPTCLLISGESRTGKSSVVKDLLETYLPTRVEGQMLQSVLYAVAPSKATLKGLLESLLRGLKDPHWSRGSETNMTSRLYTLLDAVKCKMIILDEFQHLCDKGQQLRLRVLADWLKVLAETGKYALVAVGMPEAAAIVNQHPQLKNRFDSEKRMPLFNWQDATSAAQFRRVLKAFQMEMHPFQMPALHSSEMSFRLYLASAGRIGLLAKILERAVRDAVRAGRTEIHIEDLAHAYKRAVWAAERFPLKGGPFGADLAQLSVAGVEEQVLASALLDDAVDRSGAVEIYKNRVPDKAADVAASKRGRAASEVARPDRKNGKVPARMKPGVARDLGRAL